MVKLASCFDPGVRRAILSTDECDDLLRSAYNDLKKDTSPVRHLFCTDPSSPSTAATLDSSSASCDGESAAKKMRRSLIHILSQPL